MVSYHSIIMQHFKINVQQESVDLVGFARLHLSRELTDKLFRYYKYEISEGYGPEN